MNAEAKRYPSDLTDAQWELIRGMIPRHPPIGAFRTTSMRAVVNAVFYLMRSGCSWRMLPKDYPPWPTVYRYFDAWRKKGVWEQIHDKLRGDVRRAAGRDEQPSAAIVDAQSVKTTEKMGIHGYDAHNRVNGRKRQLLVDSLGLVLVAAVHSAKVPDITGAKLLCAKAFDRFPRLRIVWADGAYKGSLGAWMSWWLGWLLEIVNVDRKQQPRQPPAHRWVVERTFAWLGRYRRLSKDYEQYAWTSETMIKIAMTQLMLRRLTQPDRPRQFQ